MFRFLPIILALTIPLGTLQAASPLDKLRPFLKQYCYECHGARKQENEKRFDSLGVDLSKPQTLAAWQGILDQLNLGDMPPEGAPRPPATEVERMVEVLTSRLKEAYARHRSTGGETVVRRLNRFELRNTVRDLLYINDPDLRVGNVSGLVDNNGNGRVENTSTDPFRAFPGDEQEGGFDNIGDRLVMSDFLLKLMLDAAEESLQLATETSPRPDPAARRFAGHINKRGTGDMEQYGRELHPGFDVLYRSGTLSADALGAGVGSSVRYRLTLEISGHNQQHPWGELIPTNQEEPFLVSVRLYKARSRNEHVVLRQLRVPGDGEIHKYTLETWIDRKWLPQVTWDNGPSSREARTDLLMQKYLPGAFRAAPTNKEIPDKDAYNQARAAWSREMATTLLENYQGPNLRVHSMTLEPLVEQWPPRSHTALYGTGPADQVDVEALLHVFAERAFRRPVTPAEVSPFVALVRSQMKPEPAAFESTAIQGLTYRTYKGKWSKLPDFSTLTPTGEGSLVNGLLDLRPADLEEHFGMVFEGTLNARQAGEYHFQIASDDGSRVIVDGQTVIEHDGLHGASTRKGVIPLKAGLHPVRVEYFAYGKPNSLQASWSGPGFASTPLAVGKTAPRPPGGVSADSARAMKALQAGYMAILCSPDFLYIHEKPGRLDDHEIATRLSYFLWSSMPDERLVGLARSGRLTKASVIQQEVDRMLDDPRAAAFTRHFTERWLRLDKLSESPPERAGPFRVYWDRRLEPVIVAQTDAYFADLVARNGPIRDLIDSDYTFLNESIATVFYGRNDVKGEFLRKVPTNDPRRGGILTQPSVMTATANGVDTSPIVRGIWVLENILGTPPPPPPPDVEPLSPDLRNAKTIREQLQLHRTQDACASCHRKIDPLGFAFENFDPIGRWRDRYPKGGHEIDPSATMSTGRQVADVIEFKKMLMDREELVIRCLAGKMLAYSSGRILESTDRGDVDEIVRKLQDKGNGIRDLIKLVVQSDVFVTK